MKFDVGEFAIVVSAPAYPHIVGKIILILAICPETRAYVTDFVVAGIHILARDHNLKKLPHTEEPESITRREECEA